MEEGGRGEEGERKGEWKREEGRERVMEREGVRKRRGELSIPSLSQVQLGRGARVNLVWRRGRVFDQEVGLLFLALVKDAQEAVVGGVAETMRTKSPPAALHTVELLRAASAKLHLGPKQAMDIAERLYIEARALSLSLPPSLPPSHLSLSPLECSLLPPPPPPPPPLFVCRASSATHAQRRPSMRPTLSSGPF